MDGSRFLHSQPIEGGLWEELDSFPIEADSNLTLMTAASTSSTECIQPLPSFSTAFSSAVGAVPELPTSPLVQEDLPSNGNIGFVPAPPHLQISPHRGIFTGADHEEAALQKAEPAKLVLPSRHTSKKKRTKRSLSFKESGSRPLGITGWAALSRFKRVTGTPIDLWVRVDRHPELLPAQSGDFARAQPILKPFLPAQRHVDLPHVLTYIECGYRDATAPLWPCRALLPSVNAWEVR